MPRRPSSVRPPPRRSRCVAVSMTGVDVTPTTGSMSPQGSCEASTGVPTCVDQITLPFDALSA